jgi:hypothetical protein
MARTRSVAAWLRRDAAQSLRSPCCAGAQAMYALKISCENYGNAVFPNAMIAGDCVITHLLHRLGYLQNGKCKV